MLLPQRLSSTLRQPHFRFFLLYLFIFYDVESFSLPFLFPLLFTWHRPSSLSFAQQKWKNLYFVCKYKCIRGDVKCYARRPAPTTKTAARRMVIVKILVLVLIVHTVKISDYRCIHWYILAIPLLLNCNSSFLHVLTTSNKVKKNISLLKYCEQKKGIFVWSWQRNKSVNILK